MEDSCRDWDEELADAVYRPGVPYVARWREAAQVAAEVNAVLAGAGCDLRALRAEPATVGEVGRPVVVVRGDAALVRGVALALARRRGRLARFFRRRQGRRYGGIS